MCLGPGAAKGLHPYSASLCPGLTVDKNSTVEAHARKPPVHRQGALGFLGLRRSSIGKQSFPGPKLLLVVLVLLLQQNHLLLQLNQPSILPQQQNPETFFYVFRWGNAGHGKLLRDKGGRTGIHCQLAKQAQVCLPLHDPFASSITSAVKICALP